MTTATPDSIAILTSRGTFELELARTITAADAHRAMMMAISSINAREVSVMKVAWTVDARDVESPIGAVGSSVSVTVEMLAAA